MRVVVSTGLGRLHFVPAAQSISRVGVEIEVVQGWVPRRIPSGLIDVLGRLAGSPHLSAGMTQRRMPFLPSDKVHSCGLAEFFGQGMFLLNRYGMIDRGQAARVGWQAFGYQSKRFIGGQNIFHVRSGAGRGGAIAKAKREGLKVVVDHSIAHPAFLERALRGEFEEAGLPFWMGPDDPFWRSILEDCHDADTLLVNSEFVKNSFVDHGFPADKVAVVYLGVRDDFFGLKKGYSTGPRLELLFTGGFGWRKGAQYLIPALKKLATEKVDFRMTVVGDATEAANLIENSSLGSRLNCVGFVPQDELKGFLAQSDLYVFPSLAEGCASSGMEAMAAGLPVIATRESGLPIEHRVDGWVIPSKSADAIAPAIKTLAQDAELRERLGTGAARKIETRFRWTDYAQFVHAVYLRAASGAKEA